MNHIFCIHSSAEDHLRCFQFLAIMNKVAMNVVEHTSLDDGAASFGSMPRSGIASSSGRTTSNFLRDSQIAFQSSGTSLHSHQQWKSGLRPYH